MQQFLAFEIGKSVRMLKCSERKHFANLCILVYPHCWASRIQHGVNSRSFWFSSLPLFIYSINFHFSWFELRRSVFSFCTSQTNGRFSIAFFFFRKFDFFLFDLHRSFCNLQRRGRGRNSSKEFRGTINSFEFLCFQVISSSFAG